MNHDWTGKLQVTLLFAYISWKKMCAHIFNASSEELIMMHHEKTKAKYMEEDERKFFS